MNKFIKLTNTENEVLRMNVNNINGYISRNNITNILVGNEAIIEVKETPEEIDALIGLTDKPKVTYHRFGDKKPEFDNSIIVIPRNYLPCIAVLNEDFEWMVGDFDRFVTSDSDDLWCEIPEWR